MDKEACIHFISGGLAGAVAATVINPLEVVKTRLQASNGVKAPLAKCELNQSTSLLETKISGIPLNAIKRQTLTSVNGSTSSIMNSAATVPNFSSNLPRKPHIYQQLLAIIEKEGVLSLWKGYGTTLVGVFPARAIYFFTYNNAKRFFNSMLKEESLQVHASSAAVAGFFCSTVTNPLWVVRTRLQLDQKGSNAKMSIAECARRINNEMGIKGFYRGVTASYLGLVETVIHFAIYERLKRSQFLGGSAENLKKSSKEKDKLSQPHLGTGVFLRYMACGSISRMIAATIAYPHEVIRTRLREENSRYNGLVKTGRQIFLEEGWRALYGGLSVHLLRTVPNTAIIMATYEFLVVVFTHYL